MRAFQRFNPEAPIPEFPKPKAAKAAKAAKAGETLGNFSQGLAAGNQQKTSTLAGLATLAGVPFEKSQLTRAVLLAVPDGVPEEWVQGVADLLVMPPHQDWHENDWRTLQDDALRFIREWAGQARRLGWEALDLFGAHPTKPLARLDCAGLVLLLLRRPVVAITENSAAIRSVSGGTLTFHRHKAPPPGCCLTWELAAPEMEVV